MITIQKTNVLILPKIINNKSAITSITKKIAMIFMSECFIIYKKEYKKKKKNLRLA